MISSGSWIAECSDSILDQLNTLNHNLEETTKKIEEDKTRIQNEKTAEEEKKKQLLLKQQEFYILSRY